MGDMEAFEDSNCQSLGDSFSLYERYMRSFNVTEQNLEENDPQRAAIGDLSSSSNSTYANINDAGNIHTSVIFGSNNINKQSDDALLEQHTLSGSRHSDNILDKNSRHSVVPNNINNLLCFKDVLSNSEASLLLENSSVAGETSSIDKSVHIDLPVSSEDTKSDNSFSYPKPVVITSLITMENSNNAVDSVPMFHEIRPSENVFKLPISELSFIGTIKHVQKLKPMVDPITALTSGAVSGNMHSDEETYRQTVSNDNNNVSEEFGNKNESGDKLSDVTDEKSFQGFNRGIDKSTESTGDSQYQELNQKELLSKAQDTSCDTKFSMEHSSSSLEASFDSGVRSPDMFSEDENDVTDTEVTENFWDFLKDFEIEERNTVKKMEEILRGVLPPPSVTMVRMDVTEMLEKYYCFLPAFTNSTNVNPDEMNSTPTKGTSFIKNPFGAELPEVVQETVDEMQSRHNDNMQLLLSKSESNKEDLDYFNRNSTTNSTMATNKSTIEKKVIKMNTEAEVKGTHWSDLMKCRYHDVHYNLTKYSEKFELLSMKCSEKFVGAETSSSVTVYSGNLPSPSSASKRKALRMKLAQGKSPGRRLSHLARRRQAFCSAATISEKAYATTSKMVLIDKNFFPHKKLTYTSEKKNLRLKRTPGRKTPKRTPGKKTPAKTPRTNSAGSSRKKAMRRLLMDTESLSRSQPTRETSKRALFISPENGKPVRDAPSTAGPQTMKFKRVLFGSPNKDAETKSLDGTPSDNFMKRKRDTFDDTFNNESRCKIPKSLSFGGDTMGSAYYSESLTRRASEVPTQRNIAELNELHKKKLLWAVSEALRVHGWRLGAAGFREKASALARLTKRLLALPPHAARLAAPRHSTSETMLKLARQYVFAIIQGRSIDDCFTEEQVKLANDAKGKVSGYISPAAYQLMKAKQAAASCTLTSSRIKENTCDDLTAKPDQPKSMSKNILQDKLVNIDSNSNSNSSGFGVMDKSVLFKSNSMPSFHDAAKMKARRQINFDNVELPKR